MDNDGTNILKYNYHDIHVSPSVVLIKSQSIIKKKFIEIKTYILVAYYFILENVQKSTIINLYFQISSQ